MKLTAWQKAFVVLADFGLVWCVAAPSGVVHWLGVFTLLLGIYWFVCVTPEPDAGETE